MARKTASRQQGEGATPGVPHQEGKADRDAMMPDVLNLASRADLARMSGVGKDRAQAIIEYRSIYGPFRSWSELERVPGFDETLVEKLRHSAAPRAQQG